MARDFVLFHMLNAERSAPLIENVSAFAWRLWNNITFYGAIMNMCAESAEVQFLFFLNETEKKNKPKAIIIHTAGAI